MLVALLAAAAVSVAGHDVSSAELSTRARLDAHRYGHSRTLDRVAGDELTEELWIEGEAARLGITATPQEVDTEVAREVRLYGGEDGWRRVIDPETPEQ